MARNNCNNKVVQLTESEKSKTGEETLLVDLKALDSVLGNPEYKDYYAAIYTIAGPTRSGKSFLLNLLWSFLQRNRTDTERHGLKSRKYVKKVFKWKKGAKSLTKGICILKKPIIVPLEDATIAVFLADSQGIFDHNTSEINQTFLGTFSFLISSSIIFNVQNRIESTHLEKIYNFGTSLKGDDGFFTTEKGSLMFIIRDWIGAERSINVNDDDNDSDDDDEDDNSDDDNDDDQDFPYGMNGGKKYFETTIRDDSGGRATNHVMMHKYFDYAFGKDIPCCLLPHPGDAVFQNRCPISNLGENFRQECTNLFQEIENERKFKIKKLQKSLCKCGELNQAIKDYVVKLGPQLDVSDPTLFNEHDISVKLSLQVKKHVDFFISLSKDKDEWKYHQQLSTIITKLEEHKQNIIKKFKDENSKFYSPFTMREWTEELERVISQILLNMEACMHSDKHYREAILQYHTWLKDNTKTRSEKEAKIFAVQAREKRESLLQQLKDDTNQHVGAEHREKIFSQCQKYFRDHTNKLIANIDADNERFLSAMKVNSVFAKIISFGLAFWQPIANVVEAPINGLGAAITESVMRGRIHEEHFRSSFGLHNYKSGNMEVEVSFGIICIDFIVKKDLYSPSTLPTTSLDVYEP